MSPPPARRIGKATLRTVRTVPPAPHGNGSSAVWNLMYSTYCRTATGTADGWVSNGAAVRKWRENIKHKNGTHTYKQTQRTTKNENLQLQLTLIIRKQFIAQFSSTRLASVFAEYNPSVAMEGTSKPIQGPVNDRENVAECGSV